uniref:complement C1q-like protein 2 isoform X1 n=2 Tax=Semicossyphus pulcher TaxID=241346 RepID=UPI0037E851D7
MEITTSFLLLLLICSPSTVQLQKESDKEIIPLGEQTEPQGREPTNASNHQQTSTQDLHALLREMSFSLAEQGVEMRHMQRENEAQAAKLRELELKTTELDKIKQLLQVTQVAFSASLLASGAEYVGPFDTTTPLVFKNVVTNIGNAYDPNTGFFIAPVRGAYNFEYYIGSYGHDSYASGVGLVKNKEHIFLAWEHQPSHYGSTANGATLLLEVGDVVFLRLWPNTRIYDNEHHHSTFSGHLLFTM